MKTRNSICIAAAILLAACTSNHDEAGQGLVALQVKAVVDGAQTRAGVTSSTFGEGDCIGVILDGASTLSYTADAEGVLSTATPFYFEDTNPVKVRAYYPYASAEELNADGQLVFSTVTQSDALDKMYAKEVKASILDPNANLTFKHLMSKISVRLISTDGSFSVKDAPTAQLGKLYTEGTFDIAQGTVAYDEGSVPTVIDMAVATAQDIDNQFAVAEAIVFPQNITSDLSFALTQEGLDFVIDLPVSSSSIDGMCLGQAGWNYIYTVDVQKAALTLVSVTGITGWTSESAVTMDMKYKEDPYTIITDVNEVRAFDLALADGTFVRIEGDTNAEMADNLSNYDGIENIRGIVGWTKAEETDATISLETDEQLHGQYSHGLILSLVSSMAQWSSIEEENYNNMHNDFYSMHGSTNTHIIKFSGEVIDPMEAGGGSIMLTLNCFDEEQGINNASEWYFPGICEFTSIMGGFVYDDGPTYLERYNKFNTILSTIEDITRSAQPLRGEYMTSNLYSADYCYMLDIGYEGMDFYSSEVTLSHGDRFLEFRPVCAF